MSFEGNPATEADGELKRSLKMIPRWWSVVVVVAAVALFGLGFAIGDRSGNGEGMAPAIDIARELGYALPLDQRPAFADGEITQEEVEAAGERLTTCVESEGVAGWHFTMDEEGYSSSYQSNDDGWVVELCRIQHFRATYDVWRAQELPSPDQLGD